MNIYDAPSMLQEQWSSLKKQRWEKQSPCLEREHFVCISVHIRRPVKTQSHYEYAELTYRDIKRKPSKFIRIHLKILIGYVVF